METNTNIIADKYNQPANINHASISTYYYQDVHETGLIFHC